METQSTLYDVAIIGAGIGGASLGMILARHGLNVIIFEAKSHPRFAIGESMILETSETMRALAHWFDVPELAYFSSENFFNYIGTSHGVKRHFSYLHHSSGLPHQRQHTLQAVIPRQPHGHELHLYRQDVDAYLTNCAIRYGVTVLQNTMITDLTLDADGVTLQTQHDETYRAAYIVDAGGYRSLLAQQFALRDHALRTHSRGLFTHMIGVPDFHTVTASRRAYGIPYSVAEGTLHHIFHGGWIWVIPFNNHRRATNPLCSVGLLLDPRIHPGDAAVPPAADFAQLIERFPAIAAQFATARPVREWTTAPRLQYSSKQIVGDRWALLGHAAGFIDPLYSKGLYTTMMSAGLLAHLLLQAHTDGDYSATRFRPLEELTLGFVQINDRLVANSFKAFSNYTLWQVYSVLWLLGAYTEYVKLSSLRVRATDRDHYFAEAAKHRLVGGAFPEFFSLANRIDTMMEEVDLANPGAIEHTAAQMRAQFAAIDWLPIPFQQLLAGKTYLPKNKIRPDLFGNQGFLRGGSYREHFFGNASMNQVARTFLREKLTYMTPTLNARRMWAG